MAELDVAVAAVLAGARARDLESATLDFKRDGRSAADTVANVAAALACFANAQGGSVVVGVADDVPGPAALLGSNLELHLTQRQVFDRTEPHLVVAIEERHVDGVRLVVASAPASTTMHAVNGRYAERVGASCQPMSAERITEVMLDRRSDDWSAQGTSVGLDQVDPVAVEHARAVLREHPDPRAVARSALGTPDLLRALGVLTPEQTLTSGGVLLFAPGGVEQIAYTFRRTMAGELSANEHLTAPLMTALRRALELVDTRQDRTPVDLRNGVQDQVADIPVSVVREAIVNAVMHRDHRRPDRIVIEHSPGRLKVTSPGALVSGVTVDTVLTTASRVRNAHLAGVIRSLGLAETAGTGIDRMYARMLGAGHPAPRYETDPSQVSVTLLGGAPDAALVRFVTALPGGRASDADAMLILHALLDRPKTTARAMAPHLQRGTQETQRVLAAIADDPDGFLEPTRESRTWAYPEYRLRPSAVADLGTAVARGRQPTDDSQRRVLDLLRESGEVTPGMVRVLLGVQPATVSRLLSGMVSRGLVVRTSPKARGPGVTYGPGPAGDRRRPSR